MLRECSADLFGFAPVQGRKVEAAFDGGAVTLDAGALLLGAADRAINLVGRFAACFADGRRSELIEHEVRTLVGQRVLPATQLMPSAPWQVPVAALATEAVRIGIRDVIARRPKNFKSLQDVSTLRLPGI